MLFQLAAMAAANPSTMPASAGSPVNTSNSSSDPKLDQLDVLLPGFSSPLVSMILKYLHIDISFFLPFIGIISFLGFAWQYLGQYIWSQLEWFISTVEIRVDDEIYEVVKSWIASQPFAQQSHRFVVNTSGFNTRRFWDPLFWRHDEEEGESEEDFERQTLHYTPAPGSHYFWYKRRLLVFRRNANKEKAGYMGATEREDISISCLGRNPWVLKQLLLEAQAQYLRRDDDKTLIYRGAMRHSWGDPSWQRSLVRACRPFETVILSQKIKDDIVEDIKEYINPATRRWYANRGIPYRRGYLLYGPPGTGKSSLSLALAGHFGMRIYIVSLSSSIATEEHLSSLFAELPRRCIVLLEDIDTAGLTHTREGDGADDADNEPESETEGSSKRIRKPGSGGGKLSLSGLLNILDGVASQEGRILIMTTNHLEKLDKALIRPGRVDMTIKFSLADREISTAIFRSIFAPLEGEDVPDATVTRRKGASLTKEEQNAPEDDKHEREEERKRKLTEHQEQVLRFAAEFARLVPENEFSPAELQGFLLKHKRHPERAVECIEEWVEATRKEKQEREKAEAEAKQKADEKKALRKAKRKIKEKKLMKEAKEKLEEDSDTSGGEASSESDDESSTKKKKKQKKKSKDKKKSEKPKTRKKAESESESESEAESNAEDEEEEQKVEIKVESVDSSSKEDAQGLKKGQNKLLDVEGDSKHEADSGYGTP